MNARNRTVKNVVASVACQAIILVLGLILPRIVLVNYGSDTNGLTSTISQVFTYMGLLQAGISISARNSFYGPIERDDHEAISFVASLAKAYYRRVTFVYFIIVIIISFVLPFVIRTSVSYSTIVVYVFFEGLTSVVTFYHINTWTSFLRANGSSYIIDMVSLVRGVLCCIVKIVLALQSVNIAYVQIGYFLVSLIQLFLYRAYMNRKYGWIKYNIDTGDAKLPDRNANLVSEIAWVVFSSTDMIVLSMFVSTSASSVYAVYNMVFSALNGMLNAIYLAVNYHLGLAFNSGDTKRYIKIHNAFMSLFVGGICVLMTTCYFLIIPFIRLYTHGVTDVNYIYRLLPLLFCLVQILSWSRYIAENLLSIAFRLKPAVKINVAEAVVNLLLSVLLVGHMGVEGVVLATVLALPIKVVYCTYVSDKMILERSLKKSLLILGSNYALFSLGVLLSNCIDLHVSNYSEFIMDGLIILPLISVLFIVVNLVVNKDMLMIKKLLH